MRPSLGTIDETIVQVGTEWDQLYAVVDLDSLYLLDTTVFSCHGTDPPVAFCTDSLRR